MHQCCLPHPGLGKGSVRVGRNSFRIRAVTHFADDAHSSRCPASFGPAGPVTGCTTVRRHIGGADESPQPEISPASEVTERPSVVVIQRNAQHTDRCRDCTGRYRPCVRADCIGCGYTARPETVIAVLAVSRDGASINAAAKASADQPQDRAADRGGCRSLQAAAARGGRLTGGPTAKLGGSTRRIIADLVAVPHRKVSPRRTKPTSGWHVDGTTVP